jgi:hypothetical protein
VKAQMNLAHLLGKDFRLGLGNGVQDIHCFR